MDWSPSPLTWSYSNKTHFDDCRRHYFYHRFWGQDPKTRWRIYEMRNISTLAMMRGRVTHKVIADALLDLKNGVRTSPETARKNTLALLREYYLESAKHLWHIDNRPPGRKPSDITNLLEHYYSLPNTEDRARKAQQVANECVNNLLGSDYWREIEESDPAGWKTIEEPNFPSFEVDDIKVYATVDFARESPARIVTDWKTGSPGERDRQQITLYALYAQSKWEWDPAQTRLDLVYIHPEFNLVSFTPTADDIDKARNTVRESFAQMMEVEPAVGRADIADFPLTDNTTNCRWCRFQGICEGARRIIDVPPDAYEDEM